MTVGRKGPAATDGEVPPGWDVVRLHVDDLGRLDLFDRGGEGTLYRVRGMTGPFRRPVLYKEYRPEKLDVLDETVLERFAKFSRSQSQETISWLYRRSAWPTWVVAGPHPGAPFDGPSGVVIPLAPPQFMAELRRSAGGRRLAPGRFELLLNGRAFLDSVGISISMRQRIQLLSRVAEVLSFLHAHSIAVGDFSCKNILFSLRPEPSCFLLDCDSMSWQGRSALPLGETPEWELPAGEPMATPAADVYKFALLVLRMHTGAQHHRSAARLPSDTFGPLARLVERSLNGPPEKRPLITDWTGPLLNAAEAAPDSEPAPASVPTRVIRTVPFDIGSAAHAAGPRPQAKGNGGDGNGNGGPALTVPSLLPPGPVTDFILKWARRFLIRQPANPSFLKLGAMLVGLWVACAAAFGLAVVAGMNPRHMGPLAELGLFGAFILFAIAAFGLATSEPR